MVIITMILFMKSYLIECVHPKGVRCFYAKMGELVNRVILSNVLSNYLSNNERK